MKKHFIIIIFFLLFVSLIGCNNEPNNQIEDPNDEIEDPNDEIEDPNDEIEEPNDQIDEDINYDIDYFYDKLCLYQEKLNSLTEGVEIFEPMNYTVHMLNNNIPEDKKYSPDYFLSVYNNQKSNINNVDFNYELYPYKVLLDNIVAMFEVNPDLEIDTEIEFDLPEYENRKYSFSIKSKDFIMISIEDFRYEVKEKTTVKLGYDDNGDFNLKEFKTYSGVKDYFYYQEFFENNYLLEINFQGLDKYIYHYISAVDDESFLLYYGDIETDMGPAFGYDMRWYNNKTKIRTHLGYSNNELVSEYYDFFDDKGILFTYSDYNLQDTKVKLSWNLLEATGWDYVYIEDIESNNIKPTDGIFKDDNRLFEEARLNAGISESHAFVNITVEYEKSEINNQLLNLSFYGLSYSQSQITVDYLERTRSNAIVESEELSIYKGVNLLGDNLISELLSVIDQDIILYINE